MRERHKDESSYRAANFALQLDLLRQSLAAFQFKAGPKTGRYRWHTQGDSDVRPSHAANDGEIFEWENPPPTGNPGDEPGCRCWGEDLPDDGDSEEEQPSNEPAWDVEASLEHLRNHVLAETNGECAIYVRRAIEAGGIVLTGHPVPARLYDPFLERHGFAKSTPSFGDYKPVAGDVAVIQTYPGGNKNGHIAMFDGTKWISDFVQRDMWGGPGYRKYKPRFSIFRRRP